MWIIKYKSVFFILSAVAILASLVAVWQYGLHLGTDFTGGTILELGYSAEPNIDELRARVRELGFGNATVQLARRSLGEGGPAGEHNILLRLRALSAEEKGELLAALPGGEELRYSSIGPVIGAELARRAVWAIVLVLVLILLFIAFAFRHVAVGGVRSWKYGVIALIALLHDLIIPTGVFAWLGATRGVEIDALFLTGLLTIFGLSVHDTIVVFDRIRENLKNRVGNNFAETVGTSLEETITRSINTSVTILLALLALYFYGAESTRWFSLLMAVGVFVGTYSSIFIASPLLVVWEKAQRRKLA